MNILRLALVLFACVCTPAVLAGPDPVAFHQQVISHRGEQFEIQLPQGYALVRLQADMQRPRLFIFDSAGNMLVGSRSGNVYRLAPPYNKAESLLLLPDYPHSLALRQGYLYIAQTSGLYRLAYKPTLTTFDEDQLERIASIPGGYGHNSRTVAVGPDNRIYLGLGISGNCSDEYLDDSYDFNDRRGGIMVLDEEVKPVRWKTYASGLRNPVGFDWHPGTKIMYASNNGPDHLGYGQPPEYFSKLTANSFHGMPWYQFDGKQLNRDDCVDSEPPRTDVQVPAVSFPARNAPMGVHFLDISGDINGAGKGGLNKKYGGDALVALHGSWGTQPDGSGSGHPATRRPPKLVLVRFDKGEAVRVDDFVTGFQNKAGHRLARPMGLGIGPDGVLYFTSDGGINGLFKLVKTQ